MTPLPRQLSFCREIHSAMVRSDLRRVADGQMAAELAEERNEVMSSVIATIEKVMLLAEVSAEMMRK